MIVHARHAPARISQHRRAHSQDQQKTWDILPLEAVNHESVQVVRKKLKSEKKVHGPTDDTFLATSRSTICYTAML